MKKIRPSYPRRRTMLAIPFSPVSDEEFRKLVADRQAIPSQLGEALFVSKWRDGPGMDPDAFLAAVKATGSHLVARRYKSDVNIRVVGPNPTPRARP